TGKRLSAHPGNVMSLLRIVRPTQPPPPPVIAPAPDLSRIPSDIAIIMDANGCWAAARGLARVAGHSTGLDAVRRTIEGCREYGVRVLTLYAFSTENWRRPAGEVEALMRLLGEALIDEFDDLMEAGVQFRMSGELDSLEPALREQVEQVIAMKSDNKTR